MAVSSNYYKVQTTDGHLITDYRVEASSIHMTEDGSWMAWAEMTDRRMGDRHQPVTGGIHVRAGSRENLIGKLLSGKV